MNGYQSDPTQSPSISPTQFDPLINPQTQSPSRAPITPTVVPIKEVCLCQDETGFVYEHSNGERNKWPWIANGKTLKKTSKTTQRRKKRWSVIHIASSKHSLENRFSLSPLVLSFLFLSFLFLRCACFFWILLPDVSFLLKIKLIQSFKAKFWKYGHTLKPKRRGRNNSNRPI